MGLDLKGNELGTGLSQRQSGQYQGRYTDRYGRRVTLYDRNLKRLKEDLKAAIAAEKEGKKAFRVDARRGMNLDKWFSTWMDVYKYGKLRESTKMMYINVYKKHISPTLGKRQLAEITHKDIQELVNELDKNGYGYSIKTRCQVLLYDMFSKAILDDYIFKNPAKMISMRSKERFERRVLSEEDQRDFFETAAGTFYNNLFVVAVNTGLRQGELCGLMPDDIDFDAHTLQVKRTLLYQKFAEDDKKEFHLGDPKTATSVRTVPLTKACEEALRKQLKQRSIIFSKLSAKPLEGFEDLLFTTKYGTPICNEIVCEAIDKIVNEINTMRDEADKFEPFSCHCFRHTFATRCFEAGIAPKTVQTYLGHASLQMTMDLYTHVTDDKKLIDIQLFEQKMEYLHHQCEKAV